MGVNFDNLILLSPSPKSRSRRRNRGTNHCRNSDKRRNEEQTKVKFELKSIL
jgi:hypothetical protein